MTRCAGQTTSRVAPFFVRTGTDWFPYRGLGAALDLLGGAIWMLGHGFGLIPAPPPGWLPWLAAGAMAYTLISFGWESRRWIASGNPMQEWFGAPLVALGLTVLLWRSGR